MVVSITSKPPPHTPSANAVWVFCEDPQLCGEHHKECWLKHRPHPDGANAAPAGPTVGWTTGLMSPPNQEPLTPPVRGVEAAGRGVFVGIILVGWRGVCGREVERNKHWLRHSALCTPSHHPGQ